MFDAFRQIAKEQLKSARISYAKVAESIGMSEGMIKQFFCGDNDSRNVAEKIADYLEIGLVYRRGGYSVINYNDIPDNVNVLQSNEVDCPEQRTENELFRKS